MFPRTVSRNTTITAQSRLKRMASHLANGSANGQKAGTFTLRDLPKSNIFTQKLPPDAEYPTPEDSHAAPREKLGPRLVKNALYTFVRPADPRDRELLGVSERAMKDLGIKPEEEQNEEFKEALSGAKIISWDESTKEGIYPWAQCYGGFQFGNWAGQLGDGRAISLFETTNPNTGTRYEIQLKGAGRTPYSRFADGKAVLRSSIREFVVSEALNALQIPTTRALALTSLPNAMVARERTEPGAIVARFAQTWIRLGTFDLLRARGNRDLIRQLATYVAEDVYGGWGNLPSRIPLDDVEDDSKEVLEVTKSVPKDEIQGDGKQQENRFTRLFREVVRRNAQTVAAWQAYAFTNGVLNTDNTSILGLSIDFGPFAFLDNFDPSYTPNHDDQMLRYSYKNQPTVIWWNLTQFGSAIGELIGAGDQCDDKVFVEQGVSEKFAETLIERAHTLIDKAGNEYKAVFLAEYKRLMSARLGLKHLSQKDFETLVTGLLNTMETLELDFNQCFRKLSSIRMQEIENDEQRKEVAKRFLHHEGVTGVGEDENTAKEKLAGWLESWRSRIIEDWGEDNKSEEERIKTMKGVNPKFIPKSWILNEVIDRVENKGDREVLGRVMHMALNPFEDEWGSDREEEERFCGDVPRYERAIQCSCSS